MSHHPPTLKKQKLVHLDDDDGDHPHSVEPRATHHDDDTAIVAATTTHSAVTALALCSETIVFSGHRDGRICRWNLTTTDHHTSNNENHNNPEWTITSACVNLTQHEQYGTEEKLGIAGLAVRRPSVTTTASSPTQNYLLYSWNHQREDMRLAINGIPQKVMIWNATTSERLSALMIDVGRCRETNMYANPLISCLVFCPLLVPDGSEVPVWTDAVLVALQATCSDAPPSDAAAATNDAPPTTTTTTALPKVTNHTPTGNIVPFHEATRKRMVPWIATGGFVRALAVVTNHNTGCVVSVTETTRPYPPSSSSSSTTIEPSVVADAADHQTKEESTTLVPTSGGGTTTSITIWDTARPGTILHVLALDHPSGSIGGGTHLPSFGSVCALTLSQCQRYLHLSMMVEDVTASIDRQHVVLRLTPPPTATRSSSTDPPDDNNDTISICGWYTTTTSTSHRGSIVASHVGDWIVTASSPTRNQVDHINSAIDNCLTWYSFHDLISSLDRRTTHDTAVDIATLLPSVSVITLPTAADTEPTALVLGPSHAIIGYEDGTVQMTSRGPRVDPLTTESTMEQRVSCSTAPIGLRGVPCPRLSSEANDVNLQNKCIVS